MLFGIWLICLDSFDLKWNCQYDENGLAGQFWQMKAPLICLQKLGVVDSISYASLFCYLFTCPHLIYWSFTGYNTFNPQEFPSRSFVSDEVWQVFLFKTFKVCTFLALVVFSFFFNQAVPCTLFFFFNTYSTFEYCNSPLTITLSALSLFSEFFLFSSHYDSCLLPKRLLSRVCTLQHVIFTSDLIFTLFLICALNQTMLMI